MASGGETGKGMINIAPNYSGHLQFMNKNNSLLIDTKLVKAKANEQYWHFDKRNVSGEPSTQHMIELMIKAHKEYDLLLDKFRPEVEKIVNKYSWKYAAQLIIDATEGKIQHYIPGTYNWWPK
jgi:hypothetical protein